MTRDQIAEVVRSILAGIAPEVDLARVRPDADLRDELDIDSMDFLRFVVGVHERLGIDVPEVEYPRIRTLDGCIAYLVRAKEVAHAGERRDDQAGRDDRSG